MTRALLLLVLLAAAAAAHDHHSHHHHTHPEAEPEPESEPEPEYESVPESWYEPGPEPEYEYDVELDAESEPEPEFTPLVGGAVEAIMENEPDNMFVGLMIASGNVEVINGEGPVTVFAPTNYAFANLEPHIMMKVQGDPKFLSRLLLHHVLPGEVTAANLTSGTVRTLAGRRVNVDVQEEGGIILNEIAKVTIPDVPATNGVVHFIDAVLVPPKKKRGMRSSEEDDSSEEEGDKKGGKKGGKKPKPPPGPPPMHHMLVAGLKGMGLSDEMLNQMGINQLLDVDETMKEMMAIMDVVMKAFGSVEMEMGMPPMPEPGMPPMGMPEPGMPPMGMPEFGMPPIGMPGPGMPPMGMPEPGMPPMGLPEPGMDMPPMDMGFPPMIHFAIGFDNNDLASVASREGLDALMFHAHMAGLAPLLSTSGPYTVLAPSNNASEDQVDALLPTFGMIRDVVAGHFLPGTLMAEDIAEGQLVPTLQGGEVRFTRSPDGALLANGASVIRTDLTASNGVIHVVDTVLPPRRFTPPNETLVEVVEKRGLSMMAYLFNTTGMLDTLSEDGPFTIFAPTDDAFMKLPMSTIEDIKSNPEIAQELLRFHIVAGSVNSSDFEDGLALTTLANTSAVMSVDDGSEIDFAMAALDGANVCAMDAAASNGVLHILHDVIMPSVNDLAEVVEEDPDLSSFWEALQSANMTDVLREAGPLTVFAPTNAAFARLPPPALAELLDDAPRMAAVLRGHLVPRRLFRLQLRGGALTTLANEVLPFRDQLGRLRVRNQVADAPVMAADVRATNGVLHKIGDVLPHVADV